ncbi:hypothetical protein ES703_84177 [subsurface metagenome]
MEVTSREARGRAAKPLTTSSIYDRKSQASQLTIWAMGRAISPRTPAKAPVIIMPGSAGRARNVARGATNEIIPK